MGFRLTPRSLTLDDLELLHHSTPFTGRAVKPQRQGHLGGPIAQPWRGGGCVCMYAWCV